MKTGAVFVLFDLQYILPLTQGGFSADLGRTALIVFVIIVDY